MRVSHARPPSNKGDYAMVLILLWLLGVPLGLVLILFLLGIGH